MRYIFKVNGQESRDTYPTRQAATDAAFLLSGTALCGVIVRAV